MKFFFLIYALCILFAHNLLAQDIKTQIQEFPQTELKKQKAQIAALVAQAILKTLPQKVDKYTTLTTIVNKEATLVYTFEINSGAKSDNTVKKEDHSRMEKAVIKGVCQSSKKFLVAGINTSYIYISEKTKKLLFRFDITQERCINFMGK